MKLGLAGKYGPDQGAALEVEAAVIYETGAAQPLAGQTFYILERSPEELLKGDITSEIWYAKTKNSLRNHALAFVITDSQGKAEKNDLKAGAYYICGIGHTQKGVVIWNVRIELKPGKNSLTLDNRNLAAG